MQLMLNSMKQGKQYARAGKTLRMCMEIVEIGKRIMKSKVL